ncbi:kinase-like domain-containing protein [Tricharina praecox]|uniref:kinase-like domain-containing protein n=1 Tax=Tricharina praecox TaxID=43433 RepID=UPI002220FABE|nr:kinase-like domain-containing protein [Tricharina praecox]KAI5858650.1 kinase-like domain-containing protein [Tricharina praecox]
MESPTASPTLSSKAVSISDYPSEITLPDRSSTGGSGGYRPSHLLRKSLSSKRLQGRLPSSPRLENDSTLHLQPEEGVGGAGGAGGSGSGAGGVADYGVRDRAAELLEKCAQWLETERQARRARRARRKGRAETAEGEQQQQQQQESGGSADESLDLLEALLRERPAVTGGSRKGSHRVSRRSLMGGLGQASGATSDTEYASDGDAVVPGCEEWLKIPEEIGWDTFKQEVLKLTHTLRCKGWRSVDLDRFREVGVERISGALTNAVYMVTPPSDLPTSTAASSTTNLGVSTPNGEDTQRRRKPAKLLLRIYGPQVSHLIDRDTELYILRRLARKKIGPRLLGTFENGRFEQFFTARTLTKDDIRNPETSRHIAKRLKELHRGIEVESKEREQGPIVWKNWEKWVPRCTDVMEHIDAKQKYGLVCGTTWPVFREAVEKYRAWLVARYGGDEQLKRELVFAHNDTQYGNILRLQAVEKSPLLLPGNEHKQLVVIDFEYASANTPGFEFANHFCEWMADYHNETRPHEMKTNRFPTEKEIRNFLTAYVEHSFSKRLPQLGAFNLDARVPPPPVDNEAELAVVREKVEKLLLETRAWRAASSAMWCAWGVVQAKAPPPPCSEEEEAQEAPEKVEEFDYLLYAQQRALLFWGDCLSLGIFTKHDLEAMQEGLAERVKVVEPM